MEKITRSDTSYHDHDTSCHLIKQLIRIELNDL